MTSDQTKATITCACCGRTVTGSLCCPKPPGSAWGAKCPEHAPATIQDVVDAIDRQTAVIERALEPRRLNIPEGEWDGKMPTRLLWASIPDVQPSEASQGTPTAADAPEPAQTLADLTPCLGDRVRVENRGEDRGAVIYAWQSWEERFTWVGEDDSDPWWPSPHALHAWTILERLDPVTPEEPPVGSGMLVDREGDLWRRTEEGWQWLNGDHWTYCAWSFIREYWRPATPADLAEHGVGEDGEPVGKGEWSDLTEQQAVRDSVAKATVLREAADALGGLGDTAPPPRDVQIADWLREYADAIEEAGDRG